MKSFTFATFVITASLGASAFAAPRPVVDLKSSSLVKRQYIDYGPPLPVNCSTTPSGCPTNGPSGTLNFPNDGSTLTTTFDNAGYVDVSYTPVNAAVGDNGWVSTVNAIFTLRQFYYGVPAFSDEIIIIGALAPPDDFSTITARLSLPARFYDGDDSEQDDRQLSSVGSGSVGEWAFQVVEQQAYTVDTTAGKSPVLIEFYSAAPLINITYVDSIQNQ